MTTTTTTARPDATERDERKRKRAAIIKFSLAGAAVLGIGAAATSAGWTDNAWFSADASAVDPATAINLQGAYVGPAGTPRTRTSRPPTTSRAAGRTSSPSPPRCSPT